MNPLFYKTLVVLSCALCFTACNDSKETNDPQSVERDTTEMEKTDPVANVDTTHVEPFNIPNQKRYFYGPTKAVITGTLGVEMHYGPPGYGENPEEDMQENVFVLTVPGPVNVFSNSQEQEEDGFDVTKQNVTRIQLAPVPGLDLDPYKNKVVRLTGTFFGAQTGHHFTEVLMDVEKVEEVK